MFTLKLIHCLLTINQKFMKKIKQKTSLLLLFSLLISLASCKKEKKEIETTAVISSAWKTSSTWVASTTSIGAGKSTYYYDIDVPDITPEIIDNGTVLVYAKFLADPDGPNQVKLLPSIYYNLGGAGTQYRFQHSIFVGKIRVICDVIPSGMPSNSNQFRYVILPKGKNPTATLDVQDYLAVKNVFQLND